MTNLEAKYYETGHYLSPLVQIATGNRYCLISMWRITNMCTKGEKTTTTETPRLIKTVLRKRQK